MAFRSYTLGEDNVDFTPADAAALAAKITGPASATDNAVARFDATTGKLAQNSLVTVDDLGNISLPASRTVDGRDVSADGTQIDANTTAITTKANRRLARRDITGTTGALVQTDEDTGVKTTNASAVTLTIDQAVAGTQTTVLQAGTGQFTAVAGSGVTLRTPFGAKSLAQYSVVVFEWISATEIRVGGETAL